MLCVLAFFSGDKNLAINLAEWIETLGGVSTHDCLLVVDKSTNSTGIIDNLRKAFRSVTETSSEPAGQQGSWGTGTTDATAANEMWLTAGDYVFHKIRKPWFWLECDAVPMRPTWLDEIESEYTRCRKPFMGAYVNIPPHEPHMSGNAVYPADVAMHSLDMKIPGKIAWDYAGRRDTVGKQKAHWTTLIQHEYRVDGNPPTFPKRGHLKIIKATTAVFHRCKDETLIARLREILAEKQGARFIAENMALPQKENPLAAENADLRARLEEMERKMELLLQRGGDDESNHACVITTATAVAKSKAAPTVPSAGAATHGKKMKKKRVLSPEHKAKLRASWEKRRAEQELSRL